MVKRWTLKGPKGPLLSIYANFKIFSFPSYQGPFLHVRYCSSMLKRWTLKGPKEPLLSIYANFKIFSFPSYQGPFLHVRYCSFMLKTWTLKGLSNRDPFAICIECFIKKYYYYIYCVCEFTHKIFTFLYIVYTRILSL